MAVIATPKTILTLINPELMEGADTLRILMLSVTPLATLTAAITKLNKEKNTKALATIGIARLIALIALLLPLTKTLGIAGAATAYLMANTLLLPIALKQLPIATKNMAALWSLQVASALLSYVAPVSEVATTIMLTTTSIVAMHIARIATLNEIFSIVKTAISTLLRKP